MPSDAELSGMTVNEIMHYWPATIRIFMDRNMLCVGCPIGGFHRLENAAFEHGIDLAELHGDISRCVHEDEARY